MANYPAPPMADLGSKALDSNLVRKKNTSNVQATHSNVSHEAKNKQSRNRHDLVPGTTYSTPTQFSPSLAMNHPSNTQNNLSSIQPVTTTPKSPISHETIPNPNDLSSSYNGVKYNPSLASQYSPQSPSLSGSSRFPLSQGLTHLTLEQPDINLTKNPNSHKINSDLEGIFSSDVGSEISASSTLPFRPHSPNPFGASPSRKLQEVFQEAGTRMERTDRLASLVHSIEDVMQKSGVNVNFTKLKDHLMHLQEMESEVPPNLVLDGELVEVGCNSPRHFHGNQAQSGNSVGKIAQS